MAKPSFHIHINTALRGLLVTLSAGCFGCTLPVPCDPKTEHFDDDKQKCVENSEKICGQNLEDCTTPKWGKYGVCDNGYCSLGTECDNGNCCDDEYKKEKGLYHGELVPMCIPKTEICDTPEIFCIESIEDLINLSKDDFLYKKFNTNSDDLSENIQITKNTAEIKKILIMNNIIIDPSSFKSFPELSDIEIRPFNENEILSIGCQDLSRENCILEEPLFDNLNSVSLSNLQLIFNIKGDKIRGALANEIFNSTLDGISYYGTLTNTDTELQADSITLPLEDKSSVGGLAGKIINTTLKNVKLNAVSVIAENRSRVGGLAGVFTGTLNNVIIENSANVIGQNEVGGMFGFFSGKMDNTEIRINSVTGNNYVGGLIGIAQNAEINGGKSEISEIVYGNAWIGGFTGKYEGSIREFSNRANTIIVNDGDRGGGMIGEFSGNMENCRNEVNSVSGHYFIGGMAGLVNNGNFHNTENKVTVKIVGNTFVGGFAGRMDGVAENVTNEVYEVSGFDLDEDIDYEDINKENYIGKWIRQICHKPKQNSCVKYWTGKCADSDIDSYCKDKKNDDNYWPGVSCLEEADAIAHCHYETFACSDFASENIFTSIDNDCFRMKTKDNECQTPEEHTYIGGFTGWDTPNSLYENISNTVSNRISGCDRIGGFAGVMMGSMQTPGDLSNDYNFNKVGQVFGCQNSAGFSSYIWSGANIDFVHNEVDLVDVYQNGAGFSETITGNINNIENNTNNIRGVYWIGGFCVSIYESGYVRNIENNIGTLYGSAGISGFCAQSNNPTQKINNNVKKLIGNNAIGGAFNSFAGSASEFTNHVQYIQGISCNDINNYLFNEWCTVDHDKYFPKIINGEIDNQSCIKNLLSIWDRNRISGSYIGGFVAITDAEFDMAFSDIINRVEHIEGEHGIGGFIGQQGYHSKYLVHTSFHNISSYSNIFVKSSVINPEFNLNNMSNEIANFIKTEVNTVVNRTKDHYAGGFIGYNRGKINNSLFTENFVNVVTMSHMYLESTDEISMENNYAQYFDDLFFYKYDSDSNSEHKYDALHTINTYYYNYSGSSPVHEDGNSHTSNESLNYFIDHKMVSSINYPINIEENTSLVDELSQYADNMNQFIANVSKVYWKWCIKKEKIGSNDEIYTLVPHDPSDASSSNECIKIADTQQ